VLTNIKETAALHNVILCQSISDIKKQAPGKNRSP